MIKPLDIAIAFMFADTWAKVFMIWLTAETLLLDMLSFIVLWFIWDVWSSGYCKLRKQVANNGL